MEQFITVYSGTEQANREAIQHGPNLSALRTPGQLFTGCGGAKRRSPIGGSAKGMPRKIVISEPGSRAPSRTPLVVAMRFSAKALWLDTLFMVTSVVPAAFWQLLAS